MVYACYGRWGQHLSDRTVLPGTVPPNRGFGRGKNDSPIPSLSPTSRDAASPGIEHILCLFQDYGTGGLLIQPLEGWIPLLFQTYPETFRRKIFHPPLVLDTKLKDLHIHTLYGYAKDPTGIAQYPLFRQIEGKSHRIELISGRLEPNGAMCIVDLYSFQHNSLRILLCTLRVLPGAVYG